MDGSMLCQCGIELLLGNRDPSKYASVPYEPGVCARSPHMAISQFGYLAQCHCREQQNHDDFTNGSPPCQCGSMHQVLLDAERRAGIEFALGHGLLRGTCPVSSVGWPFCFDRYSNGADSGSQAT
jgi:hypothetical protein